MLVPVKNRLPRDSSFLAFHTRTGRRSEPSRLRNSNEDQNRPATMRYEFRARWFPALLRARCLYYPSRRRPSSFSFRRLCYSVSTSSACSETKSWPASLWVGAKLPARTFGVAWGTYAPETAAPTPAAGGLKMPFWAAAALRPRGGFWTLKAGAATLRSLRQRPP